MVFSFTFSFSLQHAAQVKGLLEELEPSGVDVQVLCQEDGGRVWSEWVVPNLTRKAAGTLKSYLNSLQMFLDFLVNKGKKPGLPALSSEERNTLRDLSASLKGWRRTITKETSSARYAKILEETERYAHFNNICPKSIRIWLLRATLVIRIFLIVLINIITACSRPTRCIESCSQSLPRRGGECWKPQKGLRVAMGRVSSSYFFLFFPIFWAHSYFLLFFNQNLLFFLFFSQ